MPPPDTPLWLSHHWPEHYERCMSLGRHHVCRRCLVLYPTALLVAVLVALATSTSQAVPPAALWALWLLPAPAVAEWVLEHLAALPYRPLRQAATSLVAAPALGIALGLHAVAPFDGRVVTPVAVWVAVCASTALWSSLRARSGTEDWQAELERAEQQRRARLEALLERQDPLRSDP